MEAEHQETCASMPVLYVAVGRRLDYPFKKEGVDLDKLNQIMRELGNKHIKETLDRALLNQIITSTNSWRDARNKRGGNEKTTVFSSERFDSQ